MLLATGAYSKCQMAGFNECKWWGSSPFCGSSRSAPGDTDSDGWLFVASTRTKNWDVLCREISESCCRDYGDGCLSGYKRLWCHDSGMSIFCGSLI
ncbi:uncharacterized protein BO95DRAFT_445948 [Aspergillus brunneoviolaceus CBS 621.78]|uniref:Uncharacterized protein n=1 Tax=Aspergillus brunneoviolaceus CBS 621.78 TaxID=1450534 RepID=A0ACD1FZZ4_9EURO|nr:hypothetical protein BO95DRAFT_445948 [Aspergillus brunneoviolaceus CBS 621.78]RAH42549.1 hypothetical protein BO95DRAFT_445948 [Aspergillus brunneoviolaceus CBS 621.78]